MKLKEDFLQFIWQHRLFNNSSLKTQTGLDLEILKPGDLNTDAGADFFNARIQLGSIVLAGNIEIHVKTSDWLRHNHQHDRSYDNIILHVVYEDDAVIAQNKENHVEVLALKPLISKDVLETYKQFEQSGAVLPCAFAFQKVPYSLAYTWINRMAVERLEKKMDEIEKRFNQFNGDFSQTFLAIIFRAFGFKTNSLPFELLASYLPVQVLLKHINSSLQLEALLLGTAGMLENSFSDKYMRDLQNEYTFLRDKYKLAQLKGSIFKYSRLRPGNFPALRLAQLANLFHKQNDLLAKTERLRTSDELKEMLHVELSDYWKHHYKPDGTKVQSEIKMGLSSVESLIINAFAIFYFFYGKKLDKPDYLQHAINLLESLRFEENSKTKKYEALLDHSKSALESQGLIHLHDNYCSKKRCLNCAIATAVFKNQTLN
jgi:hypothetical protein